MRPAFVALPLLAVVSLVGCAENAELKKARAEAEEAKTELAKVKSELAKVKGALDLLNAQLAAQQSDEDKVMDVGKEFFSFFAPTARTRPTSLLAPPSRRECIRPVSPTLPNSGSLRKSDFLLTKYPAIMRLEGIQHRQHKLKKLSDGKTYEYFCHAREIDATTLALRKNYTPGEVTIEAYPDPGRGPWVELTVTIIQENGAWKVDKLEVDKEVP